MAARTYELEKPISNAVRGEIIDHVQSWIFQNADFLWFATRTALRKMVRCFQRYGTLTAFVRGVDVVSVSQDNMVCYGAYQ